MVYVISKDGKPLMPTERHGKVKHLLRRKEARVVKAKPFTIQLLYDVPGYVQDVTLGIDSGYEQIGFSATSEKKELLSGEVHLLKKMSERIKEKSDYRRVRRSRLRHRKPRFDHRKREKGWLAPSVEHKLDSHIRIIDWVKRVLPVTKTVVEVANFDIQQIKNPGIEGVGYQKGERYGFWNLREYILHRDGHACQAPSCKSGKDIPLQIHHVGYWREDRTDRPGNLITLCSKCHCPPNHQPGGFLYGWKPKLKPFRAETFMSTVRWQLVNQLGCQHTYGYITKSKRIEQKIEKSHVNDAFVIAGGSVQERVLPLRVEQVRRNNRSLSKFYDAQYIDTRTGQKASGKELFCGRSCRNKNLNTENLRKYRGEKVKNGRVSLRTQRAKYQPGDVVEFEGKLHTVKGSQNKGAYVKLSDLKKPAKSTLLRIKYYGKGFQVA